MRLLLSGVLAVCGCSAPPPDAPYAAETGKLKVAGAPLGVMVAGSLLEDSRRLDPKATNRLTLVLDKRLTGEQWTIKVSPHSHTPFQISAGTRRGFAAGTCQLLNRFREFALAAKPVEERSRPVRWPFRAVMVDCARRFHSVDTLKLVVRHAAAANVPYVQLHLTDDQNWMFPSPSLTGVDSHNDSGKPAYTAEELRSLQAYAKARAVEIIPEIDMPGHCSKLIQFRPDPFRLPGTSGCINFADPAAAAAMKTVIREVCDLFPDSSYIHLGGDEAFFGGADGDPHFQQAMARLGGGTDRVFADFLGQMTDEVLRLGRTPIVWEGFGPSAFAQKRIDRRTLVVAWEGRYYPASKLQRDGFRVINAGWDPYYVVNHYPHNAFTMVPLERMLRHSVLDFDLVDYLRPEDAHDRFLDQPSLTGAMMCWWEGREYNTVRVLPSRILAFGAHFVPSNLPSKTRMARLMARAKELEQPPADSLEIPPGLSVSPETSGGVNLALHKPAATDCELDPLFGPERVTDGVEDRQDEYWLGFNPGRSLIIDLGEVHPLQRIEVIPFTGVDRPIRFRLSVSEDRKKWVRVANLAGENPALHPSSVVTVPVPGIRARWVRYETLRVDQFPATVTRLREIRVY